jgi:hypothetical protein
MTYRIELDGSAVRIYQTVLEDGEPITWSVEVTRDTADLYRRAVDLAFPAKKATAGTTARFDEFWRAYPKRIAKEAAVKAWKKTNGDKHADQILSHLSAISRSPDWLKHGGSYIPYPATYLNGGYWQSEVEADDLANVT